MYYFYDPEVYGGFPPFVNTETSQEAAARIAPNARTLRAKVLAFLRTRGLIGATDEEMQDCLKIAANTQRPRRRELELAGFVKRTEQTRLTTSGRKAIVWIAID